MEKLINELRVRKLEDLISKIRDGEFTEIHNHFPSPTLSSVLDMMGQDDLATRTRNGEFDEN